MTSEESGFRSHNMAQLKLISLNLGVHFSVCLLDGVTDKRKADYFSQMIQEEHTALLVPTALRTYYPFIAATSYIKVKPLVLVDLTLTLRPFLTPEMSSILMNMAAISDETIIEKLLAQDYTSAGVFGSTVAFDCLLGFENQSISSRNKLHIGKTGELTIAVGITSRGVMYTHRSKREKENCVVMGTLMAAAIAMALDHLRRKRVRDSIADNQTVIGIVKSTEEKLCAVAHAADESLRLTLRELRFGRKDSLLDSSGDIMFDLVFLERISVSHVEGKYFKESLNDVRVGSMTDCTTPGGKIELRSPPQAMSDVFLLMGQSNMAGRGDIAQSVPSPVIFSSPSFSAGPLRSQCILPEIGPDSRVLSFDPTEGWTDKCGHDLHANVDILKRARVGLGPGPSFALKFLQLKDQERAREMKSPSSSSGSSSSSSSSSSSGCSADHRAISRSVGLIPTAVGGSNLKEWTADYLQHRISPIPPTPAAIAASAVPVFIPLCDPEGFFLPPASAYHPGCPNLLCCAMRSLYLSLLHSPFEAPPPVPVTAFGTPPPAHAMQAPPSVRVLWCQGETDSMEQPNDYLDQDPVNYGVRLSLFVGRLRLLIGAIVTLVDRAREVDDTLSLESVAAGIFSSDRTDGIFEGDAADIYGHDRKDYIPRSSDVSIVSIAVTSTHPSLVHLQSIREQQLEAREYFPQGTQYMQVQTPLLRVIPVTAVIPGSNRQPLVQQIERIADYSVVDSFGLELKGDCIHFTAKAAAILGNRMASRMVVLMNNPRESQKVTNRCGDETEDRKRLKTTKGDSPVTMHSAQGRSSAFLSSLVNEADDSSFDEELNQLTVLFEKARAESILKTIQADALAFGAPKVDDCSAAGAMTGHFKKSGLKAVNFTHGEVLFKDFSRILLILLDSVSRQSAQSDNGKEVPPTSLKFVDLGCGMGSCMAAALLLSKGTRRNTHRPVSSSGMTNMNEGSVTDGSPSTIVPSPPPSCVAPLFSPIAGLDIMRSKVHECKSLMEALRNGTAGGGSTRIAVSVIEGDFLQSFKPAKSGDTGWGDADVVYACATCFADDVLHPLVSLFGHLKPGAHVILIDRAALSDGPQSWATRSNNALLHHGNGNGCHTVEAEPVSSFFFMEGSCQVACSWGSGCAYIYRKIK